MYDIEIEGANVKVSIVDSPDLVGTKMDDLRSSLLSRKNKIKKIFITNFRKAFLKNKKRKSERQVFASLCWESLLDDPITRLGEHISYPWAVSV